MSEAEAILQLRRLGMRQNTLILATIIVITIGLALITGKADGLWSMWLLLFWLSPRSKSEDDEGNGGSNGKAANG